MPPRACVWEFSIPTQLIHFYSQDRVPTALQVPQVPGEQGSPSAWGQLCLLVSVLCLENPKQSADHPPAWEKFTRQRVLSREVAPARDMLRGGQSIEWGHWQGWTWLGKQMRWLGEWSLSSPPLQQ